MAAVFNLKENSTGDLEVTVSGEEWSNAVDKAFKKLANKISIPGFRKGKVPAQMLEKYVSENERMMQAVEDNMNAWLIAGMQEANVEPISRPSVDIKSMDAMGVTLVYTFEVMPEVKLGNYVGLDYAVKETVVTDEEFDNEINRMRKTYAEMVTVDGEAENGDTVVIDYTGLKDGVEFDGGKAEGHNLVLGSKSFIPGFEDQLIGVKTGDVKDVNVTFPEDYQAKDLAGQDAVFTVTVHDIKYKERPEINDDLIKQLKRDGVETVEKFKEVTKEDLTKERERQAEDKFTSEVIKAASDNATVDIPTVMIENEVDSEYQQFVQRMQQSGFTVEQYYQATGQTEEDMKAQMRPEATDRVKNSLVLQAIVKAENIEISQEDVDKEYKEMSELYKMDVNQIKQLLPAYQVRADLAQQKALELIKTSVK